MIHAANSFVPDTFLLLCEIEESEKAGSFQELNPGCLACAASALSLSYDNQTTTSPHNI